jgi:peptidoglycan/LPS O-acetylase OafA/YrhL
LNRQVGQESLDAIAPKPRKHHEFRPDINGLRALAVLSVLAFHAGLPAPGGFAGVDIFFVISGFLISRIILSERAAGDFSLLDFYGHRVKRILPALLLTLFACWVAGFFLFDPMQFRVLGGHMEGSSYFSVNLWLYRQASGPAAYFDWKSRLLPLLHLWSLSIEEQFYLIWPALILVLFRFKRLLTPAIVAIFLASLVWCIHMTLVNSTAAFYMLSTRAWELALGALLAQREVFRNPAPPSPAIANFGASLGLFLMLGSIFWLLDEGAPWPGFLALAPTVGCALVIASPGARISQILLGNPIAQFFGAISYPLYLWHWPLLAFAHNQVGKTLPVALSALLLAASVLLAWLTWRLVERPIAKAYLKRPAAVAASLLAGLVLAGALGSATRQADGILWRFPEAVRNVYTFYARDQRHMTEGLICTETSTWSHDPPDQARAKARAFYVANHCVTPARPDLPTIVVVGDSHGLHLFSGLKDTYRDRANVLLFSAIACKPLLTETEFEPMPPPPPWLNGPPPGRPPFGPPPHRPHGPPPRGGLGGPDAGPPFLTPRCQAIYEEVARQIVALKPAAIVVGGYYAEYFGDVQLLENFLKDLDGNIATLRREGVTAPVFVMGQVPTWKPDMMDLVIAELRAGKKPTDVTRENLQPNSLEANALLAAHAWGENVHYVSQIAKLCGEDGCRRFVGPRVPDDMIALDYGHYTEAGSFNAARNILAPVLDPVIDAARAKKAE